MSKLRQLYVDGGQSVWLDFIRRDMVSPGGELSALVAEGIRGVTSNPSIFQNAIATSDLYDAQIREVLVASPDASSVQVFEQLAIADIQAAADVLRDVYDSSGGEDGYVSLEVAPSLAYDTAGTIADAHRLWELVDRPNLMIKVPATAEGIPAVEQLIADGLNINVTLMFSLDDYENVAQAYLRGLRRAEDPSHIASVASFFVSRVDSKADAGLEKDGSDAALALRGKTAVANAKLAYRRYQELFEGEAFADLAARGARPQRVLWASTSTKNPAYKDTLYVDDLIGPNTVNTMPPATIDAFRDHGEIDSAALTSNVEQAAADIAALSEFGVDYDEMTQDLQTEGVRSFADAIDELYAALADEMAQQRG